MNSYYCIVNLPGVPAREIRVLDARDDAGARTALAPVLKEWIGFETVCLYQGERFIQIIANPGMGFPQDRLLPGQDQPPRQAAA